MLIKIRSFLKPCIKLIVAIAILFYLFKSIDLILLGETISRTSLSLIVSLMIVNLGAVFLNAFKWNFFLPKYDTKKLFLANLQSYFTLIIMPGQLLQEVSKVFIIQSQNTKKTKTAQVSLSIILDKLLSLLALIFLSIIGLVLSNYFDLRYLVFFTTFGFLIVFTTLSLGFDHSNKNFFSFSFIPKKKFHYFTKFLLPYLKYSVGFWPLLKNFIFSIFYQLISVFIIYFISQNLELNINFCDWLWINGLVSLVALLPISFAGLGAKEVMLATLLPIFGITLEQIVVISLILYFFNVMLAFIGGLCFFVTSD